MRNLFEKLALCVQPSFSFSYAFLTGFVLVFKYLFFGLKQMAKRGRVGLWCFGYWP